MIRTLLLCSAAVLAASTAMAQAAVSPIPTTPPPASDGSSGSFDSQFGAGAGLVWFNTDNGQVWDAASGGYVAFTVPYKVETWNGQTFNAYNFTDMNVESTVNLVIYGSAPAMFLASEDVSFAGQFTIAAAAGAGGAAPDPNSYPYNGGAGGSASRKAGGGGGGGPVGGVQGQCTGEMVTAGGGGGGGNLTHGARGRYGDYPVDGPPPAVHNAPGPGGRVENPALLLGGGGGGAGGGGYWAGDFYGFPGANGGGAVVIATSTGSIDIASTGVINANGAVGNSFGTGSGGGGAGGDEWFYAGGSITNSGSLTASGGTGGTTKYTSGCFKPKTVKGPNGGNGSGGSIGVSANPIVNRGLFDVSGGGGSAVNAGTVVFVGRVRNTGHIKGNSTF